MKAAKIIAISALGVDHTKIDDLTQAIEDECKHQIRLHLERAAENLKDNGYVTSERILSSITSLPIILE